MNRIPRKSKM